jgi:hypothetical protein
MSQEKIDRAKQAILDALDRSNVHGVAEGHYGLALAYEDDSDLTHTLIEVNDAWIHFSSLNDR